LPGFVGVEEEKRRGSDNRPVRLETHGSARSPTLSARRPALIACPIMRCDSEEFGSTHPSIVGDGTG
jgi:hypothetical protein